MIYCDTSYLVRLYLDEPGSEAVRALCAGHRVASAAHAKAELPAALHRSWREGRNAEETFTVVMAMLQAEVQSGAFHWLALSDSMLDGMAARFANLPGTTFLRAADALHLACAAEHGFAEVYSNDRHFLAAAPLFGLRGLNVISP